MARYQYAGPGPIEALSDGDVIRPGDIREFDTPPSWGPWEPVKEETDGAAGTQAGMEADTQAGTPTSAAASAVDARTALLTAPITPKEM